MRRHNKEPNHAVAEKHLTQLHASSNKGKRRLTHRTSSTVQHDAALKVSDLCFSLSPLQSLSTEPNEGGSDGVMRERQVSIEALSSLAAHLQRIPGAHHRLHLSEGHTSPSRLTQPPGVPLSGVLILPSSDFLLGKKKLGQTFSHDKVWRDSRLIVHLSRAEPETIS
ncbi:unnamed protein product [Pleuronectes platessa]|uniref:Uncharacterized protein n=1 Tax=Pleuronectes platessa TaxID=8262 RepID=A0A9N7VHT7_PLEPL|nr:unnamed protein product [Pleuronectes platessa]